MKKILAVVVVGLIFVLSLTFVGAGEKELAASWTQVLPDPNDLGGWKLGWAVQSDPQVWDRANEVSIEYLGGTQTDYTSDLIFTSPDGQRVTYVFRMLAYDTSGSESVWAYAAVPVVIDFESPQEPVNFTITIRVVPAP